MRLKLAVLSGFRARGALTLESGTGICRGHDPLFSGQSAPHILPIYHQCAAHVSPFQFLEKKMHFQPCFGQNCSSQDANFLNFRSQDPSFFKENPLSRPYTSGNPCGTHPPKKTTTTTTTTKQLSAPPGVRVISTLFSCFNNCQPWNGWQLLKIGKERGRRWNSTRSRP